MNPAQITPSDEQIARDIIGYRSFAEWPEHVYTDEYGKHVSTDDHRAKEEAEGVCRMLHAHGFGGVGLYLPIRTWVEPIRAKSPEHQAEPTKETLREILGDKRAARRAKLESDMLHAVAPLHPVSILQAEREPSPTPAEEGQSGTPLIDPALTSLCHQVESAEANADQLRDAWEATKRELSASQALVQQLREELAEVLGHLAAAYISTDSYGVHGSDFYVCDLCGGKSGAGVLNKGIKHEEGCIISGAHVPQEQLLKRLGKAEQRASILQAESAAALAQVADLKAVAANLQREVQAERNAKVEMATQRDELKVQVAKLEEDKNRLHFVIEGERSKAGDAVAKIRATLRSRGWMTEGRGSYEWGDDKWYGEFSQAFEEIEAATDCLAPLIQDRSDCPLTQPEVDFARLVTKFETAKEDLRAAREQCAMLEERTALMLSALNCDVLWAFKRAKPPTSLKAEWEGETGSLTSGPNNCLDFWEKYRAALSSSIPDETQP